MKAQKTKTKGNENPKRPKLKEMTAQKDKMKGNKSPKGQNGRK